MLDDKRLLWQIGDMKNEMILKMVWGLVENAKNRAAKEAAEWAKETDVEAIRMRKDTLNDAASVIVENSIWMIGRELHAMSK